MILTHFSMNKDAQDFNDKALSWLQNLQKKMKNAL